MLPKRDAATMRTKVHNERCQNCKKTIKELLSMIFDNVEINYDINLPSRLDGYLGTNVYEYLVPVYKALQNHRGHDTFVRARKLPRADFFIPNQNLIIEFDESQHFTRPREIALNLYPKTEGFGFSVNRWHKLCQEMKKRDNDPPYRDEQRAWYDTLRDFAPLLWKTGKTIRLYSRDLVWCSLDVNKHEDVETFKRLIGK